MRSAARWAFQKACEINTHLAFPPTEYCSPLCRFPTVPPEWVFPRTAHGPSMSAEARVDGRVRGRAGSSHRPPWPRGAVLRARIALSRPTVRHLLRCRRRSWLLGSLARISAEARVEGRVGGGCGRPVVGASRAGLSCASGSSPAGAAWLLCARVCPTAGRRRRTSRTRAKLRRRPRSAGVAATSDRVARPIACPPGSNRPAVAFSCMHRGCGGQPSVLVLGSDRAEARCGVRRRSARWLGRGRRVDVCVLLREEAASCACASCREQDPWCRAERTLGRSTAVALRGENRFVSDRTP